MAHEAASTESDCAPRKALASSHREIIDDRVITWLWKSSKHIGVFRGQIHVDRLRLGEPGQ
jgi:hypothetical protein